MVASEAAPFVKTGGLADVLGSLPAALQSQGHEVADGTVFPGGFTVAGFSQPQGVRAVSGEIALRLTGIDITAAEQVLQHPQQIGESPVMAVDQRPQRNDCFISLRMRPGPLRWRSDFARQRRPFWQMLEALAGPGEIESSNRLAGVTDGRQAPLDAGRRG